MDTFTILPFMVLLLVGLAPQALPIYQVNAWNVGTVAIDPWRSKASAAGQAVASSLGWVGRLFQSRAVWLGLALFLAVLVTQGSPEPGTLLAIVPVAGLSAAQIREKREKLIHDAGELVGPNNTFAKPEDRTKFDEIMTDVEALKAHLDDADRAERLQSIQRTTLPESQRTAPAPDGDRTAAKALYERAMGRYIRGHRMEQLRSEEQEALFRSHVPFDSVENRDMSTLSGAAGGFTVAPDTRFYGSIVQALKFFGGMEAAGADVITTTTGAELPFPTSDDTGNTGAIVAEEGSHAGGTTPTVGQKILRAYLYSSLVLKVSWQFLQDSGIDVESWLGARLGERLGRIQNTHFTAGTGANQPEGVMTASAQGRAAATGNSTSIPFDDVYRLIHSVDVAYRNARCRFMGHDNTALALRLAKDGQGRYLWPEMGSTQTGQPAVLAGYPFIVNNDVAQMAASAKSLSFGDHSFYKIRRVSGITIVRLNELYVANGQVGFIAFMRADGGLVDAGQNPVKHFANSAS